MVALGGGVSSAWSRSDSPIDAEPTLCRHETSHCVRGVQREGAGRGAGELLGEAGEHGGGVFKVFKVGLGQAFKWGRQRVGRGQSTVAQEQRQERQERQEPHQERQWHSKTSGRADRARRIYRAGI